MYVHDVKKNLKNFVKLYDEFLFFVFELLFEQCTLQPVSLIQSFFHQFTIFLSCKLFIANACDEESKLNLKHSSQIDMRPSNAQSAQWPEKIQTIRIKDYKITLSDLIKKFVFISFLHRYSHILKFIYFSFLKTYFLFFQFYELLRFEVLPWQKSNFNLTKFESILIQLKMDI